jgi:dihydrofolate reductase
MKNVTIIAAVGKNRELGKNNDLIWHLPDDLKFFKENTIGKPIVMGLNTLKSLPRKLKDRQYVVLTNQDVELDKDVKLVKSLDELLDYIGSREDEFMIIGGASIYAQMINHADKMLLTEIDATDKDADCFFPEFNKNDWDSNVLSSHTTPENISYKHLVYKRKR